MKKTIYLIRHGQTDSSLTRAQKSPSEPLNETGRTQAQVVAVRVQQLPIERLIASSMTRAQQTAAVIGEVCGMSPESSDLFRELAIPTELQGVLPDADPTTPLNQYLQQREQYAADAAWRFADGENFTDLLLRVEKALMFLTEQPESHIAVVSHGRFMRTLGGYIVTGGQCTGAEVVTFADTLRITNAGISVLHYEDERWRILTWNDMAHFAE